MPAVESRSTASSRRSRRVCGGATHQSRPRTLTLRPLTPDREPEDSPFACCDKADAVPFLQRAVKGVRHVDFETDRGRLFRLREGPQWPFEEEQEKPEVYKAMDFESFDEIATRSCPRPTESKEERQGGAGGGEGRESDSGASVRACGFAESDERCALLVECSAGRG